MDQKLKKLINPSKNNILLVYLTYALGIIAPLLSVIGAAFAFASKDCDDTYLRSHYRFALRTFLIGAAGITISNIANIVLIGPLLYIISFVWIVLRSIIALQFLLDDKTHPNPNTNWIK